MTVHQRIGSPADGAAASAGGAGSAEAADITGAAMTAASLHRGPVPFMVPAAVCAAIATLASFLMGRGRSLWFDEEYSLLLVRSSMRDLIALTAVDAHPPLYYLLLKAWMPVAGDDVDLMRLSSCLCMGAAVLMMLVLLRDAFGRRIALQCAPFLLCGGFMLRYGYELRMYAPAMLIAVAGTYALLHATGVVDRRHDADSTGSSAGSDDAGSVDSSGIGMPAAASTAAASTAAALSRRIWWAVYAVMVALGMYTLYMTALVWITHLIWLAMMAYTRRTPSQRRRSMLPEPLRSGVLAYSAAVVLYLPWMPALLGQMGYSVLPGVRRPMTMSGLANVLDTIVLGWTEDELPSIASLALLTVMIALVVLLTVIVVGAHRPPRRAAFAPIIMPAVVPMAIMAVWSVVQELCNDGYGFFSVRYLSIVMPFVYVAPALICAFSGNDARTAARRSAPGIGRIDDTGDAGSSRPRTPRTAIIAGIVYVASLMLLLAGTVSFALRGNHSFDRGDTPASASLRHDVVCSPDSPVVAQDEYTYIDAYWYYRDCPTYYVLDAEDLPTRGGYAPLRRLDAQLRSIDDLDADRFTLLTWSSTRDYDALLDSDAWAQDSVVKDDANAAVTYRRR